MKRELLTFFGEGEERGVGAKGWCDCWDAAGEALRANYPDGCGGVLRANYRLDFGALHGGAQLRPGHLQTV